MIRNLSCAVIGVLFLASCSSGSSSGTNVTPASDAAVRNPELFNGFFRSGFTTQDFRDSSSASSVTIFEPENNRLVQTRTFASGSVTLTEHTLDDSGRPIRRVFSESSGEVTRIDSFTYGDNGLPQTQLGDLSDNTSFSLRFFWNENNQITLAQFVLMDERGETTSQSEYTYVYENGLLVSNRLSDVLNTSSDFTLWTYLYDDQNQLVERVESAQPENRFEERVVFEFDDNGNQLSRQIFDAAGLLIIQINYTYTAIIDAVFNRSVFNSTVYPEV